MTAVEIYAGVVLVILCSFLVAFIFRTQQYLELKEKEEENNRALAAEKYELERMKIETDKFIAIQSTNTISKSIVDAITGVVNTFGKDYILATKTMNTSIVDHLNLLNTLINIEFYNFIILPRAGKKDKPPIDDVLATTDLIANRIMNALQPRFFDIFEAHGLSEEYIMEYLTREIFAKIIEFTRETRKDVNQL
jgi:biopolymer transport protein ExbD